MSVTGPVKNQRYAPANEQTVIDAMSHLSCGGQYHTQKC